MDRKIVTSIKCKLEHSKKIPSTLEDKELSKLLAKVERPTSKLRGRQVTGKPMSKATAAYAWVKNILDSDKKEFDCPTSVDRHNSMSFDMKKNTSLSFTKPTINEKRSDHKKSPNTGIKSECPSALVVPSDYVHIYKNATTDNSKPKSDAPTALIAPSDYIHIYKNERPVTIKQDVPKSDAPTALIAPSDYVHIYKNIKSRVKETKFVEADAPTALIAPSDYVHIFKNPKTKAQFDVMPKDEKQLKVEPKKFTPPKCHQPKPVLMQMKSDCPTALIAPSDYVHIYKNPKEEAIGKKDTKPTSKRMIFLRDGVPESLVNAIECFLKKLNNNRY